MPELTNPFKLVPERKLSKTELISMIRQAIIAEHDAIAQYMLQAEAAGDAYIKRVLLDIANEERVHVGELTTVLEYLTDGEEDDFVEKGRKEAVETAKEMTKEK